MCVYIYMHLHVCVWIYISPTFGAPLIYRAEAVLVQETRCCESSRILKIGFEARDHIFDRIDGETSVLDSL